MIKMNRTCLLAVTLILIGCTHAVRADHPLTPKQFNDLHQLIQPRADEQKWLQIPWMSSLTEARRKAAAQGKPILLWEMDGHPLGCT